MTKETADKILTSKRKQREEQGLTKSELLEAEIDEELYKGYKTTSRGGLRFYAEGPNAGKPVGSVRGDKASAKAIARAHAKGKISTKGAKAGISRAKDKAQYEKQRAKVGMGAASGKDDKTIQRNAREKLAEKKHRFDTGTESKAKHRELSEERNADVKPVQEARAKQKAESKKNKDGSTAKTKKNKMLEEAVSSAKNEADPKLAEGRKKMYAHIGDSNRRSKKMQADLEAKRSTLGKSVSEHLANVEELLGKKLNASTILEKAEGSRGGKVIGHTKSGKAIYDKSNHSGHDNFTLSDHQDAYSAHDKEFSKIKSEHSNTKLEDLKFFPKAKLEAAKNHKEQMGNHIEDSHGAPGGEKARAEEKAAKDKYDMDRSQRKAKREKEASDSQKNMSKDEKANQKNKLAVLMQKD